MDGVALTVQSLREQLAGAEAEVERLREALEAVCKDPQRIKLLALTMRKVRAALHPEGQDGS